MIVLCRFTLSIVFCVGHKTHSHEMPSRLNFQFLLSWFSQGRWLFLFCLACSLFLSPWVQITKVPSKESDRRLLFQVWVLFCFLFCLFVCDFVYFLGFRTKIILLNPRSLGNLVSDSLSPKKCHLWVSSLGVSQKSNQMLIFPRTLCHHCRFVHWLVFAFPIWQHAVYLPLDFKVPNLARCENSLLPNKLMCSWIP